MKLRHILTISLISGSILATAACSTTEDAIPCNAEIAIVQKAGELRLYQIENLNTMLNYPAVSFTCLDNQVQATWLSPDVGSADKEIANWRISQDGTPVPLDPNAVYITGTR